MNIKKIHITGFRDITEGDSYNDVKLGELAFTPDKLLKKFYLGTEEEYDSFVEKTNLKLPNTSLPKIEYFEEMKKYTQGLLSRAVRDVNFNPLLSKIRFNDYIKTLGILQTQQYDFSDFSDLEFQKISQTFKNNFDTSSPLAFISIDEINRRIIVKESHKTMAIKDNNFIASFESRGRGELGNGINAKVTNFKKFNFNMNTEVRFLHHLLYEVLDTNRDEMQFLYKFGLYNMFYSESNIFGTEITSQELEAFDSLTNTADTAKSLFKERQESIKPQETEKVVEERINIDEVMEVEPVDLNNDDKDDEDEISLIIKTHKEKINNAQKAWADSARDSISKAQIESEKFVNEFNALINKGDTVSAAFGKIKERYATNPYIQGIVDVSITGELANVLLKQKIIDALTLKTRELNLEVVDVKAQVAQKEDEITTVNQTIEQLKTQHTNTLSDIEKEVAKHIQNYEELNDKFNQVLDVSETQEKLIEEYNNEINRLTPLEKELIDLKEELKGYKQQAKNSAIEIDGYKTQIEQIEANHANEIKGYKTQIEQIEANHANEIKGYKTQIEQLKENTELLSLAKNDLLMQLDAIKKIPIPEAPKPIQVQNEIKEVIKTKEQSEQSMLDFFIDVKTLNIDYAKVKYPIHKEELEELQAQLIEVNDDTIVIKENDLWKVIDPQKLKDHLGKEADVSKQHTSKKRDK